MGHGEDCERATMLVIDDMRVTIDEQEESADENDDDVAAETEEEEEEEYLSLDCASDEDSNEYSTFFEDHDIVSFNKGDINDDESNNEDDDDESIVGEETRGNSEIAVSKSNDTADGVTGMTAVTNEAQEEDEEDTKDVNLSSCSKGSATTAASSLLAPVMSLSSSSSSLSVSSLPLLYNTQVSTNTVGIASNCTNAKVPLLSSICTDDEKEQNVLLDCRSLLPSSRRTATNLDFAKCAVNADGQSNNTEEADDDDDDENNDETSLSITLPSNVEALLNVPLSVNSKNDNRETRKTTDVPVANIVTKSTEKITNADKRFCEPVKLNLLNIDQKWNVFSRNAYSGECYCDCRDGIISDRRHGCNSTGNAAATDGDDGDITTRKPGNQEKRLLSESTVTATNHQCPHYHHRDDDDLSCVPEDLTYLTYSSAHELLRRKRQTITLLTDIYDKEECRVDERHPLLPLQFALFREWCMLNLLEVHDIDRIFSS